MDIDDAEGMDRKELFDFLWEEFDMIKPICITEVVTAFVDQLQGMNRKQFAETLGWKPPDVTKKLGDNEDGLKLTARDLDIICSKFPALHSALAVYHTKMAEQERERNGLSDLKAQYKALSKQMRLFGKNLGI